MFNFIKRPRFRFSLATLLLAVTAICAWLGRITYLAARQRDAVRIVTEAEGVVIYDYQRNLPPGQPAPTGPPAPRWLVDAIGPEYFQTVVVVSLNNSGRRRRNSDSSKATDETLASLAQLPEIEDLELSHNETVTDEALVHLRKLSKLKTLYLFRTKVQGPGLAHLEHLTRLENLILDQSPVSDVGLASVGKLRSLKRLVLPHTLVSDAGVAHLEHLDRLEHLELSFTKITDRGLTHLERLKSLRTIEVLGTNVTLEGVARLKAALPQCFIETSYDLGRAKIVDPLFPADAVPTADEINLRLKELKVDGETRVDAAKPDSPIVGFRVFESMLSDESLTPLLRQMPMLETLNFRQVPVGDEFLKELTSKRNLSYVSLNGTMITDDGLQALSGLRQLQTLDVQQTRITDDGLPHLYGLDGLQVLLLDNTRATRGGVEELRRRLPACNVHW